MTNLALAAAVILLGAVIATIRRQQAVRRRAAVIDLGSHPLSDDPAGRTEGQLFVDMLRETAENFYTPDAADVANRIADEIAPSPVGSSGLVRVLSEGVSDA